MAHVYCQDGFYDKAEKEFALAVTLAPAKASSYNDIGLIYMESKMLPEAEEAFKKAMSIDPYFEGAKNNLAAVYFKEGKLKELESLIGERPARKL